MGNRGLTIEGRTLFVAFAGLIAALLVWGLMAAPALAQATAKAGDAQATAGGVDVQYVDCSQVQAAFASQGNSGDAVAVSDGQYNSGGAAAAIAQKLNISQSQVNACLGSIGGSNPSGGTPSPNNKGEVDNPNDVLKNTKSASELPNTGGVPVPGALLGFGLVVAGLLSAGAIIRRGR